MGRPCSVSQKLDNGSFLPLNTPRRRRSSKNASNSSLKIENLAFPCSRASAFVSARMFSKFWWLHSSSKTSSTVSTLERINCFVPGLVRIMLRLLVLPSAFGGRFSQTVLSLLNMLLQLLLDG